MKSGDGRCWLLRYPLLTLWLLLPNPPRIMAQNSWDCSRSPTRPLTTICNQLVRWDSAARNVIQQQQQTQTNRVVNAPSVPGASWLSPAVPPTFSPTPFACMDLQCLCPHFQGMTGPSGQCVTRSGQTLGMAVRREVRTLSDAERQRYFRAVQQLKASGQYDQFSSQHRSVASSSGAHSGPGFLPFHREFTKRALTFYAIKLAIPYWDSVLDSYLPNPADSIFFSSLFAGDSPGGSVVNGPFVGFGATRRLGGEGRVFREADLQNVLSQSQIEQILAYTAPQTGCPYRPNYNALEYTHSNVHLFVGGDMKPPTSAANDPIFYWHHSFVDLIFEQFRQMRQSRWAREQAYPMDYANCANQAHFSTAQMRPFEITNRAGLSNAYTDNLYQYAPRPTCSGANPGGCGSQYLFCDTRGVPHCVSKVKPGGNCRGFEGMDVCWDSVCVNSVCSAGQFQQSSRQRDVLPPPAAAQAVQQSPTLQPPPTPRPTTPTRPTTSSALMRQPNSRRVSQLQRLSTVSNCFNDDPCCDAWAARQECQSNAPFMSRYCRRSCLQCDAPSRRGCVDRHISCNYYRSTGGCSRRRQWMAENCRQSCGWCSIPDHQLCTSVARVSRMR